MGLPEYHKGNGLNYAEGKTKVKSEKKISFNFIDLGVGIN